ncbi:MAG: HD domain-containing protein [Patescibacteria group bacterium]|nr:HD domain-containing protein [Patescibacteria group bacterium]
MLQKIRSILESAKDRQSFFKIIASIYPKLDWRYKLIEKAYNDAKDAFREIKRESGERYFEHLRAVALILMLYLRVRDYRLIVAGILHDIVEDIPSWTITRVEAEYGEEIALLVEWISEPKDIFPDKDECKRVYHSRFAEAPRDLFIIKMPDRFHNMLTLWSCSKEKKRRKIEETKRYYLPYAEKHLILLHELEAAIEELENAEKA